MTRGPARPATRARAAVLVVLGALGVAGGATGCVTERQKSVAILEEGSLAPPEARAALVGGAGRGARGYRRPRSPASGAAATTTALDRPLPAVTEVATAELGADVVGERPAPEVAAQVVPAPFKTSAAPRAHAPVADVATLERRRRETFLACTTTIRAEKATLFVPARYAAEAVLTGTTRLTLRHLTIDAKTVKLVVRTDGSDDVSISARGDVSFHADRPASLIAEEGLKLLLVRNDGYTPLR